MFKSNQTIKHYYQRSAKLEPNLYNIPGVFKATTAIKLKGLADPGTGPWVPSATTTFVYNNTFLGNDNSIWILDNMNYQIKDCFVNYDPINLTYSSRLGGSSFMVVSNNNEVAGYSLFSEVKNNQIYNVDKGILLTKCQSFSIHDNTFDMEKQASPSVYSLKDNRYSTAISINNYGIPYYQLRYQPNEITDNLILHSKIGIVANFSITDILDNTIEEMNNLTAAPGSCLPYLPPCPASPGFGIKVLGGSPTVIGNDVNTDPSLYSSNPADNTNMTGIQVENTSTTPRTGGGSNITEVSCNNVKNIGVGLKFAGDNTDDIIITYNKMNNHYYGFVLSNNGYLGDVGSIYTGPNTTGSIQNEWNGSYNVLGSHTYSENSTGASTVLYVGSGTGNTNPLIISTDNNGGSSSSIGENNSSNTPIEKDCDNPYLIAPIKNPVNNLSKSGGVGNGPNQIAKGKTPFMVWVPDSAEIFNKQLLYYNLSRDSAAMQSLVWKPFLDSMKLTPMGYSLSLSTNRSTISNNNFDANVILVDPILKKQEADSVLTSSELTIVRQLAAKCPYYDGIAVYQARFILDAIGEKIILNPCEISTPTITIGSTNKSGGNGISSRLNINPFNLYPNPAKNMLNLDYSVGQNEQASFELIDVLGKMQLKTQLKNTNMHQINLNNLQEGIYSYRLIKNDTITQSGKLIIE